MGLLALALVGSLTLLGALFGTLTPQEKQTTVERLRSKVQPHYVPNLLRGQQEKLQVQLPPATGGAAAASPHKADADGRLPYPYPLDKLATDAEVANYKPRGGFRYAEYASGKASDVPYDLSATVTSQSDALARSRRAYVKGAMKFAWDGYAKYAFGYDEVKPQSATGDNGWGGQGITLVDALDTLWLVGLTDEFDRARDWVRDHLDHSKTGMTSLFETTIRDLGGLLSAYDLSGDEAFLQKATDLGRRLLHAFDRADVTGIPYGQVNLRDGTAHNIGWTGNNAILSEFGTVQIENRYLSKMIHDPVYATKTERVFTVLHEMHPPHGLYPYYVKNEGTDKPIFTNKKLTFGAMADSFYEYMLKIWIQGGQTESLYREMYDESMEGMHQILVQTSSPSGLTYIADQNSGKMDHKMDHLVCFMGGLLALGAYTDPLGMDSPRAQRDLQTAKALTYTCYQMYARMATGISPEFVQFMEGSDFQVGRGAPHYLLRPEAIESFYILHQITGDPTYREWGWEVFLSIETFCKTKIAYGSLPNVQDVNGKPRDKMESFFLAETLKYLYLLQDPDSPIDPLHTHVFNTEAHPLRIFPKIDEAAAAGKK
jgi:mannosyl-oligosaccharide alpha-1,2-mannosidase